jgi:hypothetical protein
MPLARLTRDPIRERRMTYGPVARPDGRDHLPTFYTPREVAEILRRSVKSLYRLIGSDPSFPKTTLPGGGLLIPRLGLERWLADHSEGMKSPVRLAVVAQTSEAPAPPCVAGALK